MNDRLLTGKELDEIADRGEDGEDCLDFVYRTRVAQDAKTSKWWIEQAELPCSHYGDGTNKWVKRCCDECWLALKKQIGGER